MSASQARSIVGGVPGVGAVCTEDNYLTHRTGLLSWIVTLDHKRIGVMYLVAILASFLLGGIFAILLRTELLGPKQTIVSADIYNQFFTLHGAVMIFLVIIPESPPPLATLCCRSCWGPRTWPSRV